MSTSFALLVSIFCGPPAQSTRSSHRDCGTLEKRRLTTSGAGLFGGGSSDVAGSDGPPEGVMHVVMITSAYLAQAPSATPTRSQNTSPRGRVHLSDGFSWNSRMRSNGFGETALTGIGGVGLGGGMPGLPRSGMSSNWRIRTPRRLTSSSVATWFMTAFSKFARVGLVSAAS